MNEIVLSSVSMNVEFDKKKNLEKYSKYIDEAALKGAKLVVFPEQSLQGYLHSLFAYNPETILYQHTNAELVPEGESTQFLIKKAQEKNLYIVFGMTERDPERYDILYNTAVLVGPEGFVGSYRKVHLPFDELHIYYPGDKFRVFDTSIGKIGLMICYDNLFPESTRELALQGAEIITAVSAWCYTQPGNDPETDYLKYLYDMLKIRAADNQCFLITSNCFGMSGEHENFGCSRIVAPNGYIIADTGIKEGLATAKVDVRAQIVSARTMDLGLSFLKDRRPAAYVNIANDKQ